MFLGHCIIKVIRLENNFGNDFDEREIPANSQEVYELRKLIQSFKVRLCLKSVFNHTYDFKDFNIFVLGRVSSRFRLKAANLS